MFFIVFVVFLLFTSGLEKDKLWGEGPLPVNYEVVSYCLGPRAGPKAGCEITLYQIGGSGPSDVPGGVGCHDDSKPIHGVEARRCHTRAHQGESNWRARNLGHGQHEVSQLVGWLVGWLLCQPSGERIFGF